jgi:hypothetical protein
MKLRSLTAAFLTVGMAVAACAQGRGNTEVTINGKKVSISYGRPELKGRDMLGKAAPGTIWRFGSNSATVIESTGDLDVAGTVLKAGKYSLWTKKTDSGWLLMFHRLRAVPLSSSRLRCQTTEARPRSRPNGERLC